MAPPPVKPAPKATPVSKVAAAASAAAPKSVKRALPGTAAKKPAAKKRKAKKDEKSTTTTTTQTANIPVNVYDAVLGEAEDLLAAAMEAQALGRLKMASAYQLLLHARLVGLGKRFDRAQTVDTPASVSSATTSPASTASVKDSPPPNKNTAEKPETPDAKGDDEAAASVQELAKLIPSNVELDSAMMEHLARAAMELHHQRTGRRIQSNNLMSPPAKSASAASATPKKTKTPPGVAWSEEELTKFQEAIRKGTKDPAAIAKAVGTRTEAQVKAYLRNTQERQKGAQAVEQEWQQQGEDEEKAGMEGVSPRKRGGRGRKPPTQAMNTVPNAKLDARSLLSGKAL